MEEVEVFINAVKAQKGQAFNIADLLHISISNVVCSMAFGERFDHDDKNFRGLVNAISDNLSNAAVTGLLTFFPFLKYIPGDPVKYRHVMGNVDLVNGHLRRIVDEHKQKIDYNAEAINYIDSFLRQQKEDTDTQSTFTGTCTLLLSLIIRIYHDFVQGQGNPPECQRFAVLDEACRVVDVANL